MNEEDTIESPVVITLASILSPSKSEDCCHMQRSPSQESLLKNAEVPIRVIPRSATSSPSILSKDRHSNQRLLTVSRNNNESMYIRVSSPTPNRPTSLWFEEETEVIRNCAILSAAVGLQKSFSTSDISEDVVQQHSRIGDMSAASELALNSLQRSGFLLENARLELCSRSCSTWVAVGDLVSASQLPSPHGGGTAGGLSCNNGQSQNLHSSSSVQYLQSGGIQSQQLYQPVFTAVDFIRSVNKKIRHNYIKKRLLTTYKALERISSEALEGGRSMESINEEACKKHSLHSSPSFLCSNRLSLPNAALLESTFPSVKFSNNTPIDDNNRKRKGSAKILPLIATDISRERGRPLSKYERNMMIFDWLHTLDHQNVLNTDAV